MADTLRWIGEIAVAVRGSGPAILFLHGVGGNRRNWDAQLEAFSARATAAAWDARGYGDSGGAVSRFEDFADDAADVIAALGGTAHVVGLSMGGRIALDLWNRHRETVSSLTLADTSAGAPPDPAKVARALELRLRPLEEEGKTPADIAETIVEEIAGPGIAPAARTALLESHRRLRTEGYAAALRAVTSFSAFPPFAAIDVPVLVITGEHDRVAAPAHARAMADAIPGASFVEIAGAGHISNIEAPGAFNAALGQFLEQLA
ncbi:MAG: alpha/beta fold hydrolase [Thermaurantiacus sp.]